jgi:uncharacterized FlgJ-related protein
MTDNALQALRDRLNELDETEDEDEEKWQMVKRIDVYSTYSRTYMGWWY